MASIVVTIEEMHIETANSCGSRRPCSGVDDQRGAVGREPLCCAPEETAVIQRFVADILRIGGLLVEKP